MRALLRALGVVFRKELRDGLRDRRSMFSALLYPLVGPLLVGLMLSSVIEKGRARETVELPTVGIEHAPALAEFLHGQDIEVVEGPADPEAAVEAGEVDYVLVIPEEFPERFREARPAPLRLVTDGSRDAAVGKLRRIRGALQGYGQQVGALRLVARGVAPDVATPVQLDEVDVATPQQTAARVLNFIPMFVVMAAFVGGLQIAVDATAGERERKSLEPLLITPVPRGSVVLGKWLTGVIFASVSIGLTLVCCLIMLWRLPLQDMGLRLDMGAAEISGVLLASLPMACFAVGLQMLVGTFARTYKEAQTYLSLLILVPMLPAFMLIVNPIEDSTWMFAVPALGQQLLLTDVMSGEPPGAIAFVLAGLSALAAGLVCVGITGRLFQREQIIFG